MKGPLRTPRTAPADLGVPWRVPLLVLGFVSLAAGVAAGLGRLGWQAPLPALLPWHGPLMVCGFFGTLISLERAVALARRWAYVAPLCAGGGSLLLFAGAASAAPVAFAAASALLLLASLNVMRRQPAIFTVTLALGAASWLAGNLFWLAGGVESAVPWWAGFLVLTIAGERLELSRLRAPPAAARRVFTALVLLLLLATALADMWRPAHYLIALAAAGLTLWLLRYDIARRTVSASGLTRFIAVALLSGYLWLGLGALAGMLDGGMFAPGPVYGVTLHAVFLGFVFAMVFGHAPLILPAVTRLDVVYHPVFYLHLALLHLSLVLRLCGELLAYPGLRSVGGALNAAAIGLFVVNTVSMVIRGRLRAARAASE